MSLLSFSQVKDDFNDGDYQSSPLWMADSTYWTINDSFQLQTLKNSSSSSVSISTASKLATSCIWSFDVHMAFSPSSSNRLEVFLISDSSDLTKAQNGYFLRIGKSGSEDGIDLYRLKNGSSSKIISGRTSTVSNDENHFNIKVIRHTSGLWNLFSDTSFNQNYLIEDSVSDNEIKIGAFFGFLAKYTVSRSDLFSFDNINIVEIPDSIPPLLKAVSLINDSTLLIQANEKLNTLNTHNLSNYSLNSQNSFATRVQNFNGTDFELVFDNLLLIDGLNTLNINSLKDFKGNISSEIEHVFEFDRPQLYSKGNVIITEIMADPSPSVDLPEVEYIELYNDSKDTINLIGWQISDPVTTTTISTLRMFPNTYLILCKVGDGEFFENSLELYKWPSLNNSGDSIYLMDSTGQLIDSVFYSDSWYGDSKKSSGGYSLEKRLATLNNCINYGNWAATLDISGGSPGRKNTLDEFMYSLILSSWDVLNNKTIKVNFNQAMNSFTLLNKSNYKVNNSLTPDSISLLTDSSLFLHFTSLPLGFESKLVVSNVRSCFGEPLKFPYEIPFYFGDKLEPLDLVINEILFNPKANGSDFVELYNRSDKKINLKELKLANRNELGELGSIKSLSDSIVFLEPMDYVLISTDFTQLANAYVVDLTNSIKLNSMPTFPNESGEVVLLDSNNQVIDELVYSEDQHHSLIKNTEGVSLERINHDLPTQQKNNWHSAAASRGFATPGLENSQFQSISEITNPVEVYPEHFTPNFDGVDDYLTIALNLNRPGYSCTIQIFDKSGFKTRTITSNSILSTHDRFVWDGLNESGMLVKSGIYIISVQYFHLNGESEKQKLVCVVGS